MSEYEVANLITNMQIASTVKAEAQARAFSEKEKQAQLQIKEVLSHKLLAMEGLSEQEYDLVYALGEGLIEGDLRLLECRVESYAAEPQLLIRHISFLALAFSDTAVSFLETTVFKAEIGHGQHRLAAIMSVYLKQALRVLAVPTVSQLESRVYSLPMRSDGCNMMQPEPSEEPRLLAKQIGRILCLGSSSMPPPMSGK